MKAVLAVLLIAVGSMMVYMNCPIFESDADQFTPDQELSRRRIAETRDAEETLAAQEERLVQSKRIATMLAATAMFQPWKCQRMHMRHAQSHLKLQWTEGECSNARGPHGPGYLVEIAVRLEFRDWKADCIEIITHFGGLVHKDYNRQTPLPNECGKQTFVEWQFAGTDHMHLPPPWTLS